MTVPVALTAISLFATAVLAGLIGVVSVAIRKEDKNLTLAAKAPDNLTRVARWLTGLHVLRATPHHPG
ncbi:MAG TPA: hypothetical protein VIY52_19790 [Streptosporangiaceae bacterium]